MLPFTLTHKLDVGIGINGILLDSHNSPPGRALEAEQAKPLSNGVGDTLPNNAACALVDSMIDAAYSMHSCESKAG